MKKLNLTAILTISPVLSFLIPWKQVWRGNLMKSLQRKWLSPCKFWFLVSIQLWSWKGNPVSLDAGCPTLAISSCPHHQPNESTVSFVFSAGCRQTSSVQAALPMHTGFFWSPEMHYILFGNGRIGKRESILLKNIFQIIRGSLFIKLQK